ncbi:proteinase-activated receptor 3-like [Xiphophorus maculatus]|uniref:Coagulation factor II thrombin receptor like 2 n=1 Tax=Xiphophorus maculatus TaxID=8083 RepID=M4AWV9_XIPMA|nr:proteinase-activated receptor 3-like [Xiphophorus maculatus]
MRKLFILLLLFALFVHGTLQKHGKKKNLPEKVFPQPRVFLGIRPTLSDAHGTQPPNATDPPSLQGLSDTAVGYLKGLLSTRVIPVIYLLAVIVGIPTNITILCLLATKIRKVSSAILYCSLAAFDLLLLVSLFFKAHYHLLGNNWVLGEAACKAVTACFYGNLYGSALTLAFIAVKRYMAVVHPFMFKTLPKKRCMAFAVLVPWLAFGASVVPQVLVQQTFWVSQLNRTTCHDVMPLKSDSHKFLLFCNLTLAVLCLLVPMVVTTVCFIKILTALNQSHYDWAMYIKSSSLVFTIFLLCFLPTGVLHFLHYVQLSAGGAESLYKYFNMAVCLCCLHACLDPFFFFLMSKSAGSKLYFLTFKGKNVSVSF